MPKVAELGGGALASVACALPPRDAAGEGPATLVLAPRPGPPASAT